MQLPQILCCPICLSAINEPTTLSCGHTMCRGCVEQLVKTQNPTCPLCRKPTFAPLNNEWIIDENLVEIISIYQQSGEQELINQFPQIVMCLDCGLTPVHPIVLGCQHLFCKNCIKVHLENDLICPACNEWATFIPGTLSKSQKYQELIEWYNSKTSSDMEVEENTKIQTKQDGQIQVNGIPLFFYDQIVQLKQRLDLMIVEERYNQLLRVVANGSGHFPIVQLINNTSELPMYGDLVQIQKIRAVSNKQSYVQVMGTNRIIIRDIYSFDQNGSKLSFSLNQFKNMPGQLWMCSFDIIHDEYSEKNMEQIISLWFQVLTILSGGFEELSPQLKELFLPAFQIMNLFSKLGKNSQVKHYSIQLQFELEDATLILLRLLKIPSQNFLKLYYCPCLLSRLQYICEYFDSVKMRLINILGVDQQKKQQATIKKSIQALNQNIIRLPQIDCDEEDDDHQQLSILKFSNLSLTEHFFMNMFKLEQVAQQGNE